MHLLEGVGVHGLTCEYSNSLNDCTAEALQVERCRKPGHEAPIFKTAPETSRMTVDDDNSGSDILHVKSESEYIGAKVYRESLTSIGGFTRGPQGLNKFYKDTQMRRREEMSEDGVEMTDAVVEDGRSRSRERNRVKSSKQKLAAPDTLSKHFQGLTGYILARG